MTSVTTMKKIEEAIYKHGAMTKTDFIHVGFNGRTVGYAIPILEDYGRIMEVRGFRTVMYDLTSEARARLDKKKKEEAKPGPTQ